MKAENVSRDGVPTTAANNSGGSSEAQIKIVDSEQGFEGAVTVASQTKSDDLNCVTVNVPYLDLKGHPKMGQARLYVKDKYITAGKKLPVTSYAHYEADMGSIQATCDLGWIVVTPHFGAEKGEYPLEHFTGDSFNLARAINEWVRRLPIYDRVHLHIVGGSAGGYETLVVSAEMFPVSSAFAGQPVFNLPYNLNYFEQNRKYSSMMSPDGKSSMLPVLNVVTPLKDQAAEIFGDDLTDTKWYYLSPVSMLDRITCPIVVTGATGDMLCPAQQLTGKYVGQLDGQGFPDGFTMDFHKLTQVKKAQKRLDEIIPASKLNMIVLDKPDDTVEMMYQHSLGQAAAPESVSKMKRIDIPWNKSKQWTLLLHNEGAPSTYAGHFRYFWNESPLWSYSELYKTDVPAPSILNAAKLQRLIERYECAVDSHVTLKDGTAVHRTNYPTLEKLDVVTSLLDYINMGSKHTDKLNSLYKAGKKKPFGEKADQKTLSSLRDGLLASMK